jgi:exodeoxyribonuclease V
MGVRESGKVSGIPQPTPHQRDALAWLVRRVQAGAALTALRGLAGTGKTTLIPHLRAALASDARQVAIGTPTHRAAAVLRSKDIADASTIHSLCLEAYFTPQYAQAVRWLGGHVTSVLQEDMASYEVGGPHDAPPLVTERLARLGNRKTPADLYRLQGAYEAGAILASIGIHGRHHFAGFGPKGGGRDVLIIDEASMVSREHLAFCQQVFQQIVLVGDPGQLAPVNAVGVLDAVEGIQLTEIHRQAAESPLLRLAYRAREGYPFWKHGLHAFAPTASEYAEVPAQAFAEAPLLVWKNRTRVGCTQMIRRVLRYPPERPVPGEPLVCRSADPSTRVDGLYNNGLFRVRSVATDDARDITMVDELTGEERTVLVHLEEIDGDCIELDCIPFRFGYVYTVHTAQGGEWPTVYISRPDLKCYAGACWHQERLDDLARWTYTAITRAKENLGLLTQHAFLK